ncbi:MAG: polymer-forming cytoskeletal protein [Rhodospirillaceae bacterium]|nr:polymer-forming cytoskeletal protein [Rhodospirillaceae bacterium]MCA8931678.1 polymer-forming cytoskeletal protein [Rhodospirillaceae bacterium]
MKSPSTPLPSELSRRGGVDMSGARRRFAETDPEPTPAAAPASPMANREPSGEMSSRRLLVGREISLAGEINSCDHLVVEGRIEAKLKDCRIIEVADGGIFKGSADIEQADIGGRFDGDLSVRGRLKIRGSGVISGNVRYGELEVEVGGRLIGTMEPLDQGTQAAAAPPPPPPAPEPAIPDLETVSRSYDSPGGDAPE